LLNARSGKFRKLARKELIQAQTRRVFSNSELCSLRQLFCRNHVIGRVVADVTIASNGGRIERVYVANLPGARQSAEAAAQAKPEYRQELALLFQERENSKLQKPKPQGKSQ